VKFVAHKHEDGVLLRGLGEQWPPKTLVKWATMHLAPPIIDLLITKKISKIVSPDVRF